MGTDAKERNLMAEIEAVKQGQIKPVYLVVCETYFQKQFLDQLVAAVLGNQGNAFDFDKLDGRDYSLEEIVQKAQSCPMFSHTRLIVVTKAPYFEGKLSPPDEEALKKYLESPVSSTVLVFLTENVDKRSKMVKSFTKHNYLVEYKGFKSWEVEKWLLGKIKEEGWTMSRSTTNRLLEKTNGNLNLLEQELEKLRLYKMDDTTVTIEDIELLVPATLEHNIFKLVDRIGERKISRAMSLLRQLILYEQPVRILFMIGRQVRLIIKMKEALEKGDSASQAGKKLKVPPFVAKKIAHQARNFSYEELGRFLRAAHDTDYWIKTGRLDPALSLERLLMTIQLDIK